MPGKHLTWRYPGSSGNTDLRLQRNVRRWNEIWGSLLIEAIRINELPRKTEKKEQHCGARQEVKHIKQKWLKN